MRTLLDKLIDGLTSMKLTIGTLVAGMVLVLAGTLAQTSLDLQIVQEHFFRSMLVWLPVESGGGFRFPVFPGGHLIGAVLLVNLAAAHVRRFSWTWRKLGIHMAHAGLIIIMAGGLFTDLFSVESNMRLGKGETKNYSEDTSKIELAIIDSSGQELDQVTVIPPERLRKGNLISHQSLPFSLSVRWSLTNSRLQMLSKAGPGAVAAATQDLGAQIAVTELPRATGASARNLASAVIEVIPKITAGEKAAGSLGTWLVSEALGAPQSFTCGGKRWAMGLRPERHYKPYSLKLLKFTHEVYPGTQIPKNYSSAVLLSDSEKNTSRNALIYMNHPLRYRGDTFYQSGFDDNDTTTILQVVHNPAVVAPYLGCVVVGVGLLFQFTLHLVGFSRRLRRAPAL